MLADDEVTKALTIKVQRPSGLKIPETIVLGINFLNFVVHVYTGALS